MTQRIRLPFVIVLLRYSGGDEERAEVGEPAADGVVFVRPAGFTAFIPFRDTGERTEDGLPVFEYGM